MRDGGEQVTLACKYFCYFTFPRLSSVLARPCNVHAIDLHFCRSFGRAAFVA